MRSPPRPLIALVALLSACPAAPPVPEGAPTANAGPDLEVAWGRLAILRGACTDPRGGDPGALRYTWEVVEQPSGAGLERPEGADAALAWFAPGAAGRFVLGLTCSSGEGKGARDEVVVTVAEPEPNRAPTLRIVGSTAVESGVPCGLGVEGFDPDGDSLTFTWRLARKPAKSVLVEGELVSQAGEVRLTPDLAGEYELEVRAEDGQGGSASATAVLTAQSPEPLARDLEITVVDGGRGTLMEGATVIVAGAVVGTTGPDGVLAHRLGGGLAPPVDITVAMPGEVGWDHDGDRATPPVLAPRWRLASALGVASARVRIPLSRTEAGAAEGAWGRVAGEVSYDLFDRLPEVRQLYSVASVRSSGQIRTLLVAPLLPLSWAEAPDLGQVLAPTRSQNAAYGLPGNLATDDLFLNDLAGLIGQPKGPGGEDPFGWMDLPLPAGPQRLYVVGGLVTAELATLLGAFVGAGGVGSFDRELPVIMGALRFETLFLGVVSVDVSAGGTVDLLDVLSRVEDWDLFAEVEYDAVPRLEVTCDAQDRCIDLERMIVHPASALAVTTGALPPDARVSAAVPTHSPFEVRCPGESGPEACDPPRMIDLAVPSAGTGTDLPYALEVVGLAFPAGHPVVPEGGLAMAGFQFDRTPVSPGRERRVYPVPRLEGALAGASYGVSAVAYRGTTARASDARLALRPGHVTSLARGVYPGLEVALDYDHALPQVAEPTGGLEVEVLFEVTDPTVEPPEVRLSQAVGRAPGPPGAEAPFPEGLHLEGVSGADLLRVTVSPVDRAGGTPAWDPRWELWAAGASSSLVLPPLPPEVASPAGEVWVTVEAWEHAGGVSQALRARVVRRDAFSFRRP